MTGGTVFNVGPNSHQDMASIYSHVLSGRPLTGSLLHNVYHLPDKRVFLGLDFGQYGLCMWWAYEDQDPTREVRFDLLSEGQKVVGYRQGLRFLGHIMDREVSWHLFEILPDPVEGALTFGVPL